jgi:hypothetical protein
MDDKREGLGIGDMDREKLMGILQSAYFLDKDNRMKF